VSRWKSLAWRWDTVGVGVCRSSLAPHTGVKTADTRAIDDQVPASGGREDSSQLLVVLNEVILPEDEDVRWESLNSYNILDTVRYGGGGLRADVVRSMHCGYALRARQCAQRLALVRPVLRLWPRVRCSCKFVWRIRSRLPLCPCIGDCCSPGCTPCL
jgi:hypothetical protein